MRFSHDVPLMAGFLMRKQCRVATPFEGPCGFPICFGSLQGPFLLGNGKAACLLT